MMQPFELLVVLAWAAVPLVLIAVALWAIAAAVRRPTRIPRGTEGPAVDQPTIVLPRPNPLERHRIDPIAFVAGGLTVAIGVIGLLHQTGAISLGPGAVAVVLVGLTGVGVVAAVLLWPRRTERIEDPRLNR